MDLGLLQKHAARILGCTASSLILWEKGRMWPGYRWWPGIIAFLGYDPLPEPGDVPGRLKSLRRRLGISQKELAGMLKVDSATVEKWEHGRGVPMEWRGDELRALFERVGVARERNRGSR